MLANGLRVLVREDRSAPVVAIVTHVNAGYFDEGDDVVGISHVLEHMYFKGTPTRAPGEIARETKRAGGYLNAATIYDSTRYYTVLPSRSFAAGLAVQADAYANSLIDAGELGREIEVIIEEERRKRDSASAVAVEECYALLHDVHRMRRWRIGTGEGLRRLTRDDLLRFYRRFYTPSNTVLSIAGDVDRDEAIREVEHRYGGLPPARVERDRGPAEPERRGFRWRELVRDVEHTQLVMGWRTVPVSHSDAPALAIAAAVLGAGRASRLFREVRERSLASAVATFHYTPQELGVFTVSAEVPPERSAGAARAIWAQIRQLAADGPSPTELSRVRRGIEARWRRGLESMEAQASNLAAWETEASWERGAEYLDALLAVEPGDIQRALARYLTLDRAAVITLRAPSSGSLAPDLAGAREMLADAPPGHGARTEPAAIEAPGLVGLGTPPEQLTADVAVYRTDGGVPILVRRKPGAPIARAEVLFLGGVCDETDERAGRTSLLVKTALQGTAHRTGPQFAEDLESLGASIGSVAGLEAFGWSLSAPTPQLGRALCLLAEVAEEPALPEDALETERTIAIAGLARLRDDMASRPAQIARAAAFGQHAYGRSVLGTEAAVQRATTARLRSWHERRARHGSGAIIVVADAPPDEVAAQVRGAFRGLVYSEPYPVPTPAWPPEGAQAVESRDRRQTALTLLLPGMRRSDPRRHALSLLTTVASGLGGRLFDALRDRESLAYSVSLSSRSLRESGWLAAYLACAPEKEAQARAGLERELRRFAGFPVSEDELQRAKAYALGSLAIRQQSAASVLGDIADAWLFGTLDELTSVPRTIEQLTAGDLLDAAQATVDMQRAVWGAVGQLTVDS